MEGSPVPHRLGLVPMIAALLLVLASACSSAEDRAAKERIFSPEDPPRVLQAAAESLDLSKLPSDAGLLDRVVSISAAEARARIGPHVQKAKVEFRWSTDAKTVKLSEERFVALGDAGDFHVRIENDERKGMEWFKLDGVSYTRSRYAPFRERRRDRGSSEHVVDSAYATLETFDELVHGAMRLESTGEVTIAGRRALRFGVMLGEPRKATTAKALPPIVYPKDGPDPDTALRLAAASEGRTSAISGHLAVDAATGVPLEADLRATVVVPAGGEERLAARLELQLRLDVSQVGDAPAIAIPEHLDDAPRPPGVVATLRAYGLGQAPEADAPEEPADDD